MPLHFTGPDRGSVSSTILRLERERQQILTSFTLPDGTVCIVTGQPPAEVRATAETPVPPSFGRVLS